MPDAWGRFFCYQSIRRELAVAEPAGQGAFCAHGFTKENAALQRKSGAGNDLISVSLNIFLYPKIRQRGV